MFYFTSMHNFLYFFRFAMNSLFASALIKILYASSSYIFLFICLNSIDYSWLYMFIPFSFNQLLILYLFLLDLLIHVMICLIETLSNVLDHLFMLLTVFHICSVSRFQFFNLFLLISVLDFFVNVSRLPHWLKELILFLAIV